MAEIAIFVSLFAGVGVAFFLSLFPIFLSGDQAKARARRLADARMNARLLRLNL
jgi:hypothetical protein